MKYWKKPTDFNNQRGSFFSPAKSKSVLPQKLRFDDYLTYFKHLLKIHLPSNTRLCFNKDKVMGWSQISEIKEKTNCKALPIDPQNTSGIHRNLTCISVHQNL